MSVHRGLSRTVGASALAALTACASLAPAPPGAAVYVPAAANAEAPAKGFELPTFEWLLDLHAGRRSFETIIDPVRGVFLAEAHTDFGNDDPPADADGWVRRVKLVCGGSDFAELSQALAALDLIAAEEIPDDGYGCNALVCWIRGQTEYAMSYTFQFRRHPERGALLDAVIGVEGSLESATQDELTESLHEREPDRHCSKLPL